MRNLESAETALEKVETDSLIRSMYYEYLAEWITGKLLIPNSEVAVVENAPCLSSYERFCQGYSALCKKYHLRNLSVSAEDAHASELEIATRVAYKQYVGKYIVGVLIVGEENVPPFMDEESFIEKIRKSFLSNANEFVF